ncbi:BglG family transcription antiterminator [Sinanaerobacter chloroacetimidivorans]|jgi:mannitol operon transcriptional antiterminator|uniref:BglG family transcription antiterminator n=1 Tax=Sinanaerobacter chloroacetimidivorans TaxID=2818044 RepID=A0A8J8B1H4_9FIRM|nr:BglG family transcription antiterminator [Sinanaerobacter chloroacetimidivorans]MBR0598254.1 BglG family transcription antiterminator [Sinanaerobacter chloroacetimidivorans]
MELNGRMVNILNAMINSSENSWNEIPVSDLLSALKITKRTFYYNFDKISKWLKENDLGTVSLSEGNCFVKFPKKDELKELLQSSNTNYFMSAEERHALEILYITLSSEIITIEQFQQMFDVSKNTILADIKKQKENLKEFQLDIKYSAKQGYFIEGEEFSIRKFLGNQVYRLGHIQAKKDLYRLLDNALFELTGKQLDFRDRIRDAIRIYETDIDTDLVQSYVEHEVLMIFIAYKRCMGGRHFTIDEQEKKTLEKLAEYKGVQKIISCLNESCGLNLCEQESYYITILLLGVKNFDFNSKIEEDSYIRNITKQFIANVERNANITIKDREPFMARLVSHIGPMYYRVKYDIKIENPLLDDIKAMYKQAFEVTRKSLGEVEGDLSDLIDDNEMGYLAMYIGGELNQVKREIKADQKNGQSVLIVCGAGVAASVLIKSQLIELIGDQFNFVLCSVGKLKDKNLAEYSLAVSTVRFDELPEHTVYVGAVLSEQDKRKIITELNKCKMKVMNEFTLGDLMKIISGSSGGNLTNGELEEINYELCRFFHTS